MLDEELRQPGVRERFLESVRDDVWPRCYKEHELVVAGRNPYPLAIYLDGVPFQKRDGLLAIYGFLLVYKHSSSDRGVAKITDVPLRMPWMVQHMGVDVLS